MIFESRIIFDSLCMMGYMLCLTGSCPSVWGPGGHNQTLGSSSEGQRETDHTSKGGEGKTTDGVWGDEVHWRRQTVQVFHCYKMCPWAFHDKVLVCNMYSLVLLVERECWRSFKVIYRRRMTGDPLRRITWTATVISWCQWRQGWSIWQTNSITSRLWVTNNTSQQNTYIYKLHHLKDVSSQTIQLNHQICPAFKSTLKCGSNYANYFIESQQDVFKQD